MKLCTYSKSEIHASSILDSCPLALTSTQAKMCPCRKRLYHVPPNDLRVLSCEFPNTWRGDLIRNPEALSRSLKIDAKTSSTERRLQRMVANAQTTQKTRPPEPEQAANEKKEMIVRQQPATITVYDRIADPLDFVAKMGGVFFNSKMFGCNNIDQGKALAFAFLVKRIDPFEFRLRHHIIGGNLTMSAEAMLADFRAKHGGSHRIVSRTPEKAAIELTLGKQKQLFEFTWQDAQNEDYCYTSQANDGKVSKRLPSGEVNPAALKDNWKTPRRRMQMLWARVVSDGVGAMCPEVSSGHQTPEELGVLSSEAAAAGVIDVDFTVMSPQPAAEADDQPAESEPAGVDAVVEAEPTAEQPPFDPTPANAQDAIPKPQPAETPVAIPSQPSTPPASAAGPSEVRATLLRELKALKDQLLTAEQYHKVLEKKGVKSATELDLEQLERMVHGLRERKAKLAAQNELKQWAEGALQPKN